MSARVPSAARASFEHGVSYVCEKSVGPERTCDFRSGKMILQQPVERAQMQKLLATGRTDLLNGFVSKRGRRFRAYMVKTPEGKVGFEFQPRPSGRRGRIRPRLRRPRQGEKPIAKPRQLPAAAPPSKAVRPAKVTTKARRAAAG